MQSGSYIFLALVPAVLWSSTHIIDKVVVSKYIKNPLMCTLWSAIMYLLFAGGIFFFTSIPLKMTFPVGLAFLSGIIYMIAILMYYKALLVEEVSRVTPLLMGLVPLFVLLLATIFFTEIFTLKIYFGIFLILIGSILISFKREALKIKPSRVIVIIIFCSFLLAAMQCLWKGALGVISYWDCLFWFYLGAVLVGFILITKYRKLFFETFGRVKKRVIGIMSLSCVLNFAAILIFVFIISKWFVSLASVLSATEGLFTLFFAVCLSIFIPRFLKEELKGSTVLLKFSAIILMILGIYFIS